MRTCRVWWPVRLGAFLLLCLVWPAPAEARLYAFCEPPLVLPHASHVVRIAWPPTQEGWPVLEVYRGEGVGAHVDCPGLLLALPGTSAIRLARHGTVWVRGDGLRRDEVRLAEIVVALYALGGRYHVVGGRPGHEVPTRSAVWCVDDQRRVYRDGPSMTGDPVLCRVDVHSFDVFEQDLRTLLAKHPFEGPSHRPVPEAERDAFFAVVDPAVDWYTRRAKLFSDDVAGRKAAADAIAAYGRSAPSSIALHVFDALQILGGGRALPHEVTVHIHALLVEVAKRAGIDLVEALIQHELARGPYIDVDRTLLLWVLRDVDPAAYRRGVETLRALCRKQMHDEAVGAYWALKSLGEDLLVQEIDALWAEWEKDDPTAQVLREAEQAEQDRKAEATAAATTEGKDEPAAPQGALVGPPPRIEVADAREDTPLARDPQPGHDSLPWPVLGLAALLLIAGALALRRR